MLTVSDNGNQSFVMYRDNIHEKTWKMFWIKMLMW